MRPCGNYMGILKKWLVFMIWARTRTRARMLWARACKDYMTMDIRHIVKMNSYWNSAA